MAAIGQKEAFEKLLKKTESKKQNQQSDLEHVNQGKKTIRTMFKSEKDATQMMTSIESSEKDLENLGVLLDVVTIYLGEQVVPAFKRDKLKMYQKLMQQFTVMEINNAHQTASFWSNVLTNPNVKNATVKA